MWDDLNSNPWQVGNWLANWVGRLCRSWSWLQQWIGQCHRKPRKRSRSWSCRLIHRRSWDQNNGWRCTSRCILMIWFRFRCSWSTQSHPPLTQLLLLLFKPLQTSGAMAVSSWGWRHSPGFRSPCRQPAVSFRWLPRQKYCSRQSLGERPMRQTMTIYIQEGTSRRIRIFYATVFRPSVRPETCDTDAARPCLSQSGSETWTSDVDVPFVACSSEATLLLGF